MRRTSTAPTKSRGGLTLFELMVSASLLSMVFLGTYLILDRGYQFYRLNTEANDRQRETLAFLTALTTSMQNVKSEQVYVECSSPVTLSSPPRVQYAQARGVAAPSALDALGRVHFNANNELLWPAYEVFYLLPNGELYFRRVENVDNPAVGGPVVSPPSPPLVQMAPANFTDSSRAKLLARQVTELSFLRHSHNSLTGQALDSDYYDVTIQCGRRNEPLGFWIETSSSFYPRN